ncbi:hypothetical protein Amal_03143 [Acetobacter malorum]|uniref:Uncharacterized protein n=1 Tax=Acetobacter malorum TaxID=178901 RepID=A0A177G5R0_9PROT|nr:hypothetical protein [Acetobacter malorum]OAG75680.1 hypothetical protein Amal_03143 [Acetobacter malorum]
MMIANIEFDEGKLRLRQILDDLPNNAEFWNEAQNRFQFIDRILRECLGWDCPYIEVEKYDEGGGYADYLLGQPVKAAIEAKREASKFKLLQKKDTFYQEKLKVVVDNCPIFRKAYGQILEYCVHNGARLAVVCNGSQIVVFQSYILGQPVINGDCFIFDGKEAFYEHFFNLWQILSPEGIYENYAFRVLSERQNPKVPSKASTILPDPKMYRYRTIFQEKLRAISSILLDNIEGREATKGDFYRDCYVDIEASNRNTLLSKKVIADRYKRVSDNGISPAKIKTHINNNKLYIDSTIFSLADGRPLVVIGDVGVGKTSFFEKIFEDLDSCGKNQSYYIHINLGEEAALSDNVKTYVVDKIPKILKEDYKINIDSSIFVEKVYKKEIIDFDDSLEGSIKHIDSHKYHLEKLDYLKKLKDNRSSHVIKSLIFLHEVQKIQIIVVLDNGDQRNFSTQQEAFLVAQEISSSRKVFVFVALRPATFYQSKLSGALSGYKNQVLTISPPPADEVILKRISYALRVAEGKINNTVLNGIDIDLNDIILFLVATLRSIKSNKEIRTFLSNITSGNTRLVIELFTSFCGSPNVEAERIVQIEKRTSDYKVPLHEFTKHALLGEYAFYSPSSSLVACNVYDIFQPDKKEHFLSSLIISYLASPSGERDKDGFINGSQIIKEMMRIGFIEKQIRPTLRRLANHRLIETPHAHYREILVEEKELPETFCYRSTSVGIYHVRYWMGNFSFLDATSIDTPIFDSGTQKIVFANVESFGIKNRYEKTIAFKKYLLDIWYDAMFDIDYFNFKNVLDGQNPSFLSVENYLAKEN